MVSSSTGNVSLSPREDSSSRPGSVEDDSSQKLALCDVDQPAREAAVRTDKSLSPSDLTSRWKVCVAARQGRQVWCQDVPGVPCQQGASVLGCSGGLRRSRERLATLLALVGDSRGFGN